MVKEFHHSDAQESARGSGCTPTCISEVCFHCKSLCESGSVLFDNKTFCCNGCKTVYEILHQHQLCDYYVVSDQTPLRANDDVSGKKFEYLDTPEIQSKLLDFQSDTMNKITFYIPSIHCSSCIWLLENAHKLHPAILESTVDFLKKQVFISYQPKKLPLSQLVTLLASIGYEPLISLHDVIDQQKNTHSHMPVLRLAVSGFCAGNIMMFSFPEYFGLDSFSKDFGHLFGYLNLLLSLPVFFFGAWPYIESVISGIKHKTMHIDIPIFLGIFATFARSIYEVVSGTGSGYFDSMSGLVFLLLIGKWFQQKTFAFLSFERDFKSYFPLAVTRCVNDVEQTVIATNLAVGDKIKIYHEGVIPADAILYKGNALIDYSFVTGESVPVPHKPGDLIYAGGRQKGDVLELEVVKPVSQSYLTQLWNHQAFAKSQDYPGLHLFTHRVAKYFTLAILALSAVVSLYWFINDSSKILNAFTAILIIACPCTLSLSYPIALGNVLRLFGRRNFFIKNNETLEKLSQVDTFVFDKTGTLTDTSLQDVSFVGEPLLYFEKVTIYSLVCKSAHPLSRAICQFLETESAAEVLHFEELLGKGIKGTVLGMEVCVGSASFVGVKYPPSQKQTVYIKINHQIRGYFEITNHYKKEIADMVSEVLKKNNHVYILSGDTEAEKETLEKMFPGVKNLWFRQSPQDKMEKIALLQQEGKKVAMIGDGLNDSGALKQAYVGIAVTENTTNFTPSSDIIALSGELVHLPAYIRYAKHAVAAVKVSFGVSLIYNTIGLYFAVQGNLQPIIAAILMPLSSLSVVGIAMFLTGLRKLPSSQNTQNHA